MSDLEMYLQIGKGNEPRLTLELEYKITESYPRNPYVTGFGRKIPTQYMAKLPSESRWKRVYVTQFSNSGTPWIYYQGRETVVTFYGGW